MARTVQEIKNEITGDYISNDTVIEKYGLAENDTFDQKFSRVSLESILFYIHAFRVWQLETLFDRHIEEATDIIANKRAHTIGWYRRTAMAFQYGSELSVDIAEYDNTGLTEEEVAAQRIITKCAVVAAESVKPTLTVKVAKSPPDTNEGGALNADEKAAFTRYMDEKADAGVSLNIVTGEPDRLWLNILIRHDGLVLNSTTGDRLVGGGNPVKDATTAHLKNLVFNGTFFPSLLEQDLMRIPGIKVATIQTAQAAPDGGTLAQFTDAYVPLTGALKINVEEDLITTYQLINY
jgi:hypothetical protein